MAKSGSLRRGEGPQPEGAVGLARVQVAALLAHLALSEVEEVPSTMLTLGKCGKERLPQAGRGPAARGRGGAGPRAGGRAAGAPGALRGGRGAQHYADAG